MTTKQKAEKLFKKTNLLLVSCIDSEGYPLTKAVLPGKIKNGLQEIYFCTNTSSHFAQEIMKQQKGSIYFYSKKFIWKGCYLKGKMEIVTDPNEKQRFWQNKFKKAYKQQSYQDPDFCVIKFTAKIARFYSWFKPVDFNIN